MSLLPVSLRSALEVLAEGHARTELASRSRDITATYRARQNSSRSLLSDDDALAYALARMPATFAATAASLVHLSDAMPGFAPNSLLDVGCGPGTASFAAVASFPELAEIALLDRNGPFLALARTLADAALGSAAVRFINQDVSQSLTAPPADLVIASYVLAELPPAAQTALIHTMWTASRQVLLLVEPGTPDGFARLKAARSMLVAQGAHVAAPCTHEAPCPMMGRNWCRFFARVQRSRDHRLLKGGDRPFEDEPYAYLALVRTMPEARKSHRIVARPVETKAVVMLDMCGPAGLTQNSAPSRNKELFRKYKRLDWGDAVEIPIQEIHAAP